jgi:Pentapeptide repeats (8 copies)
MEKCEQIALRALFWLRGAASLHRNHRHVFCEELGPMASGTRVAIIWATIRTLSNQGTESRLQFPQSPLILSLRPKSMNETSRRLFKKGTKEWNAWRRHHPRTEVDLSSENLSAVDVSGADLRRVDFSNSNLADANLSRTNLSRVRLERTNLQRTKLSRANLEEAILISADLREADLNGAQLKRTNMAGCNLEQARLQRAGQI